MASEEDLAAEWDAMGDGDEEEDVGSARVLNQDEIDSLLGFDEAGGGEADTSGIHAIVNSALVSYERLPMLEVVFDRLVRMMSTSLRNFTSDHVDPVRRLPELDSATRYALGLQSRGMGQLRLAGCRLSPDLFDRRCLAGGTARHSRDADRRPALYHHRTQSG